MRRGRSTWNGTVTARSTFGYQNVAQLSLREAESLAIHSLRRHQHVHRPTYSETTPPLGDPDRCVVAISAALHQVWSIAVCRCVVVNVAESGLTALHQL